MFWNLGVWAQLSHSSELSAEYSGNSAHFCSFESVEIFLRFFRFFSPIFCDKWHRILHCSKWAILFRSNLWCLSCLRWRISLQYFVVAMALLLKYVSRRFLKWKVSKKLQQIMATVWESPSMIYIWICICDILICTVNKYRNQRRFVHKNYYRNYYLKI